MRGLELDWRGRTEQEREKRWELREGQAGLASLEVSLRHIRSAPHFWATVWLLHAPHRTILKIEHVICLDSIFTATKDDLSSLNEQRNHEIL